MTDGELRAESRQPQTQKKAAEKSAAWKVDNREASNRVDRSHSVSKRGQA